MNKYNTMNTTKNTTSEFERGDNAAAMGHHASNRKAPNRRNSGLLAAALLLPFLAAKAGAAPAAPASQTQPTAPASPLLSTVRGEYPPMHKGKLPVVAMVLYDGMTLLDTVGPLTALNAATKVYLVAQTKRPIVSDTGVSILPTTTFDECPKDLDVLFVGGGSAQVLEDKVTMGFIADRGSRAKYVTSVCTGSIVLGAAGLLKGYKATSHWAARDMLPMFGATLADGRVVVDRNRMSGGGVTAGIDFGLALLATLVGEDTAKMSQLAMEYNPKPPFNAGTPQEAGPELVKRTQEWIGPIGAETYRIVQQASQAMPK